MHVRWLLVAAILAQWQRPVAFTKALDLLCWVMHRVWYWRTAADIKLASKGSHFLLLLFCLLLPLRPLGGYAASSRPMAASSGFRSSPGHAALEDAICVAPATAMAIKMANDGGTF
jgi:hypothetical protein